MAEVSSGIRAIGMSSSIRSRKPISSTPYSENEDTVVERLVYDSDKTKPTGSVVYSYATPVHWILFTIFVAVIFFWAMKLDAYLPPPLSAAAAGESRFSEERARRHFETIASFGPRPSNSPNCEILTRDYLLTEIEKIQSRAQERKQFRFDVDIQKPSGCLPLSTDFINCYKNVTNIVVRLGQKSEKPSQHSLLVNCHFDSVPAAPGATDDAISCAVMLEMLNVFTGRSPKELPYDLIFLFNGAEENYLQASHGFITQHSWRHSIEAFINLEGSGAGGRELLFQAGPGNTWLSHAYLNNAPYPHCNILAQELFEAHLIPSDTDFRVFRDFGYVPGMDFAYIANGYVYHTEFDQASLVGQGCLQRAGENLLATISGILHSPCFTKPCPEQDTKLVFFDFLGLFVISYPLAYGTIVNYAVAILVLLRIARRFQESVKGETDSYSIFEFLIALVTHIMATLLMTATALAMIRLVNCNDLTMCWYSRQFMVIPLYLIPTLVIGFSFHLLTSSWYFRGGEKKAKNPFHLEEASLDAALALLSLILLLLTWYGIASAYYVLLHILFPLTRSIFVWGFSKVAHREGKSATALFICHAISLLPVAAAGSYGVLAVLQFFIPIMGRSGTVTNPEYFIAVICVACSVVIVFYMGGLVHISKSFGEILNFLIFIGALTIAVAGLTSFAAPYRYDPEAPRLRRINLQHVSRTIYDVNGKVNSSENALFITGMDFRGVEDLPPATFLQGSREPPCVPEDAFCALPYSRPSEESCPPEKNLWINVPSSAHFATPIRIRLIRKEELTGRMVKFSFAVTTHDHASLFITPLNNWTLHEWTFTSEAIWPHQTYFVRACYVGRPQDVGPWEFSLTLKPGIQSEQPGPDQPKLLLGVASHYVYGPDQFSESTLGLVKNIRERRENPPTASLGYWKWMMTPDAFNSEFAAQYFA